MEDAAQFRTQIYKSLISLATDEGINASGKDEIYGCIFGRDSAITILKILKIVSNPNFTSELDRTFLLDMCRRSLLTLVGLQGKEFNRESGEEPGKYIHEYRKSKYEHLLRLEKPWYVYEDGILRNYDSIDSTPLTLLALYRYWNITRDDNFLLSVVASVEKGLEWIVAYGDRDGDGLVEYKLDPERKFGGLSVQSWTDSQESLLQKNGTMPKYPIAPVEVQGYVWLAFKAWGGFYKKQNPELSKKLFTYARRTKKQFNKYFLFETNGLIFPAQALDGEKRQIRTITGNPLLLLWASYETRRGIESILHKDVVYDLVKRSFMNDMFDADAGIRTMSMLSDTYNSGQDSYHNGSFWPKLNGMVHEGLSKWGYFEEARLLKAATLRPLFYFKSPIELYIKNSDGTYSEFKNASGQVSCREQAWSAAVALDLLTQD